MNICLLKKEEISVPLKKNDERAVHITKILHKKEGETFAAGIIGEEAGTAHITKIDEDGNIFFEFTAESDGKKLYPLVLIVGFPRPIQLRRLFRDAAGLGVERIILTGTALGEKSYLESNILKDGSAERMLLEGSAQAASTHIPELELCKSLSEAVLRAGEICPPEFSVRISLDNKEPFMPLGKFLDKKGISKDSFLETENLTSADGKNPYSIKKIFAAIGSERGWTDSERKILSDAGFVHCSMGKRILRTETAVTTASSIILEKTGFLD